MTTLGKVLSFFILAGISVVVFKATSAPPAATDQVVYNVMDYGAIGDGNIANAAVNTTAFTNAIAAASSAVAPGTVLVPSTKGGFVVNDGVITIAGPNVTIRGEASMGSNLSNGPTSAIIAHGAGHTITVSGQGGSVRGLEFRSMPTQEQNGSDAFLQITNTAVTISDLHMWSPNTGISLQLPIAAEGEFWVKDVLIEGQVKTSGITANAGNAAVSIQHCIMFSQDPQPPYGVAVTSCGELVMGSGCDIISMGTCLALVPGLGGVKGQHANAAFISDCLFDSPNGNGVLVKPQADGYASLLKFTNCWASTQNNAGGTWPANGFTLDGTQSVPPVGIKPIMDVTFTNCSSRNFVQHCGWYCKGVYGLTSIGCTASGNFMGFQTYGCVGNISCGKFGDFTPAPLGFAAGNAAYGILIEKSQMAVGSDNLLLGNGKGGIIILP